MLYQIERRLANLKTEIEMQEKDVTDVKAGKKRAASERIPGSKVVAIDVDPVTYAQLQKIAKKHGVHGVRGALSLAAKAGLRHL